MSHETIYFIRRLTLCRIGYERFGRGLTYPIVGTGQTQCYDAFRAIAAPLPGQPFYGQDAQHPGCTPSYRDNGDGTITDRATDLMWSKADSSRGMNWQEALTWVQQLNATNYLGHHDWRLPNTKEL